PGDLSLFRVGRVLEAAKHPNADRLQLCVVDIGEREPAQIVRGAWNFGAGATVAGASPGATLPNRLPRRPRGLPGTVSGGTIVAEEEAGLGAANEGTIVPAAGLEPGPPPADVLPLAEEVLEIEPTGNRPDLQSVYGIAREVAAPLGGDLEPLDSSEPAGG